MSGPAPDRREPLLLEWREAVLHTPLARSVLAGCERGERVRVSRLPGSLGIVLMAAAATRFGATLLAIFPESEMAESAALDFSELMGSEAVSLLPPLPAAVYEELSPPPSLYVERHRALEHLSGRDRGPGVVVASVGALLPPVPSPADLRRLSFPLAENQSLELAALTAWLTAAGYERETQAERGGVYAVRGGLIDIVPPGRRGGLRVEFWGDEIESVREYGLRDQRTVGSLGRAVVPAAAPFLLEPETRARAFARSEILDRDRLERTPGGALLEERGRPDGSLWYFPLFLESVGPITGLLPAGTLTACWEPERCGPIAARARAGIEERYRALGEAGAWLPPDRLVAGEELVSDLTAGFPGADLPLVVDGRGDDLHTDARPAGTFTGDFDRLRSEVAALDRDGIRTVILVEDAGQQNRLRDLLTPEDGEGAAPGVTIGQLERGFTWPEAGLAVWPDHEIFGRPRRIPVRSRMAGEAITSWRALTIGDHVVHVDHGIGRFEGLRTLEVDGLHHELLEVAYAGNDRLLVPVDQLNRIQRYTGADPEAPPTLNTLGAPGWERAVERARTDLLEMAGELARIYAAREAEERPAWPTDDLLMEELEASFPWTETPDQARAVREVKADLEKSGPMDRLICGDVGYGKTEVAVRAALKVVEGGGQVAVLVPTTVLAQQHLETFRTRLGHLPVRIEMLSRFRTPVQQRSTLAGLAAGTTDLVIGTHRLLSEDVSFARLGLVIIDEEHRFGVRAKERLRRMRARVDVLSMTATPIPRTLHMSLSGLRDISIITTPPEDRLPVQTEVATFDPALIEAAIRREHERGGQVFFVHNRVQSIGSIEQLLRRLVPEARIEIAHGQMNERRLEQVMIEFAAGAVDVLVSTMIVESGLDLPNANTLIVNRADRLGLAQLYQLRGRVGRSSLRAYAWFLVPRGRTLSRDARRRLQAVREHSDLGAGFQLAMRDLEIRGAGNLLGPQQHGHIAAVGIDLYQQMLAEAVADIRGTRAPRREPPRIETGCDAYLPESYIPIAAARIGLYRRAVEADELAELQGVAAEMTDRFGPPPPPARAFLSLAVLRWIGTELGLDSLVVEKDRLLARFPEGVTPEPADWEALLARTGEGVRFRGRSPLTFEIALESDDPEGRLSEARNLLLTEDEAEYVTGFVTLGKPAEGAENGMW